MAIYFFNMLIGAFSLGVVVKEYFFRMKGSTRRDALIYAILYAPVFFSIVSFIGINVDWFIK